ncbi:hypothetical protein DFH09DRAFT_1269116 [Mycena vulgaris]|nr:hypothetical protein DFH09DRAFT_1269116 [Mycena vulgaris]
MTGEFGVVRGHDGLRPEGPEFVMAEDAEYHAPTKDKHALRPPTTRATPVNSTLFEYGTRAKQLYYTIPVLNCPFKQALNKSYKVDSLGNIVTSWPDTLRSDFAMSDSYLDLLWSKYHASPEPGMQSLYQTCSAFTKHVLHPSHIILSGGGFTLHPDLADSLPYVVRGIDQVLRLAAQYHGLANTRSIGLRELNTLTVTTSLHCATQNEIVLAWVTILDRLGAAMRELKALCCGDPFDPSRHAWATQIPQIASSLPLTLRTKLPKSLLALYGISTTSLSQRATSIAGKTSLDPSDVVDRGDDPHRFVGQFALEDHFAISIENTVQEMQVELTGAFSPTSDRTTCFVVDPRGELLQILRSASSVGELRVAWAALSKRMGLAQARLGQYQTSAESIRAQNGPLLTRDLPSESICPSHFTPTPTPSCPPGITITFTAASKRAEQRSDRDHIPRNRAAAGDATSRAAEARRGCSEAATVLSAKHLLALSAGAQGFSPPASAPVVKRTKSEVGELGERTDGSTKSRTVINQTQRLTVDVPHHLRAEDHSKALEADVDALSSRSSAPALVASRSAVDLGGLELHSGQQAAIPHLEIRTSETLASTGSEEDPLDDTLRAHSSSASRTRALVLVGDAVEVGGLEELCQHLTLPDFEAHTSDERGPTSSDRDHPSMALATSRTASFAPALGILESAVKLDRPDTLAKSVDPCDRGRLTAAPYISAPAHAPHPPSPWLPAPALVLDERLVELGGLKEKAGIMQRSVIETEEVRTLEACDSPSLQPPAPALVFDEGKVELGGPKYTQSAGDQLISTLRNESAHTDARAPRAHSSFLLLPSVPLSASEIGIFALVSAILRTCYTSYLGHILDGELAPYLAWEREGIGTPLCV